MSDVVAYVISFVVTIVAMGAVNPADVLLPKPILTFVLYLSIQCE